MSSSSESTTIQSSVTDFVKSMTDEATSARVCPPLPSRPTPVGSCTHDAVDLAPGSPASKFEKSAGPPILCAVRTLSAAPAPRPARTGTSAAGETAYFAGGEDCGDAIPTVFIPQSLESLAGCAPTSNGRATHTSPRPVTRSSSTKDLAPPPPAAAPKGLPTEAACPCAPTNVDDPADTLTAQTACIPPSQSPGHRPVPTSTCSGLIGMQAPMALTPRPRELRRVRCRAASTALAPLFCATCTGVRPLKSLRLPSAPALTSISTRCALLSASQA